jgi:pimeloyl-ACP methyl ester carboxylesterase
MPSTPRDAAVEANGLSLHYLDWGGSAAVPAIAFHGFALNCHSWDEVAPALLQRVRLLAFDQRGHGLSDRAPEMRGYSRDAMVADIEGIVRRLELDRPVILGHSMGGMNALCFAGRHPDRVRALVLVDVGPEIRFDGANEVIQFVQGPYELESLDAWVEHTHRYYPYRSKEGTASRSRSSRPSAGPCESSTTSASEGTLEAWSRHKTTSGTPRGRSAARRCSFTAARARC